MSVNRRSLLVGAGATLPLLAVAPAAEARRRPVSSTSPSPAPAVPAGPLFQDTPVLYGEHSARLVLNAGRTNVLTTMQTGTAFTAQQGITSITIFNDGNGVWKKGSLVRFFLRPLDGRGLLASGRQIQVSGGMHTSQKTLVLSPRPAFGGGDASFVLNVDVPSGKSVTAALTFALENGVNASQVSRVSVSASLSVNPTDQNYFEVYAPEKVLVRS